MRKTVLNALGRPMFYSDTSTRHFSATGSGPVLTGSAASDSMWGDSVVNVTMKGGAGDDIYYLYSAINRAYESAGQGIDTVSTWMSYTLPTNIENLTVTGDLRYAFGNSTDNIIKGAAGRQTLDGYGGNDVLFGGAGADTFIFSKGNGSDLVVDLGADDSIRLKGYAFTSFDQILDRVTQQGANLKLDLGGGESLVFADRTVADLRASQFELQLDRSAFVRTFNDDFNILQLRTGTKGLWEGKYWWAPEKGATLPGNGELQWYVNPAYAPTSAANPFSVSNGVLTITAQKTPASVSGQVEGHAYTSGMLTTHSSFAQTYGYFEIRADMPDDKGVWPAFWLLPEDGSWPPELDVVEMRGQDQNTVHVTVHSNETGTQTSVSTAVSVAETTGFHTYGVLWQEDEIVWYIDDVAVARADTPSDMHDPMYMIVNLAVGGSAGAPGADLDDGSHMKIDYIRAYTLDDLA